MKNDTKDAEKLKELLSKADHHPMMKAILAEEAGKIQALKKERDEIIPKLQNDIPECNKSL